jgi:hypothetical protein
VLIWVRLYKIVNKLTLVSGTNIKTINDASILGAGNIAIAGAGSKDFIASGAIDDGKVVYLNADGTVTMVSGNPESIGTPVVFESAFSSYISSTFDSLNNRVVIAYRDGGNSSFGTAIVGTVSGTSISFGTAVIFESANSLYISTTFDSLNNKIVIAYQDGGNSSLWYGNSRYCFWHINIFWNSSCI